MGNVNLVLDAMLFAMEKHANQKRNYTGAPYAEHLAEVAAMTHAFGGDDVAVASAWLHDVVEDQGVTEVELLERFGAKVTSCVMMLSDLEQGTRVTRKALSVKRLSGGCARVHTVKLCDLISNTKTIVKYAPGFAKVYLMEKVALLPVLTNGPQEARAMAENLVKSNLELLMRPRPQP